MRSDRPPAPEEGSAGSASLYDDDLDAATILDAAAFRSPSVPAYPPIGIFGRFEILGKLAMGGMAEIFLARDRTDDGSVRHVVIKRVLPHMSDNDELIRMFLDEAGIANRLYHPQVCHVYEAGKIDGACFMAMEWVHGTPLRRVIRRASEANGVPVGLGVKIISQVAEALHYCHHAVGVGGRPLEIVHRDVSPHNIMLSWTGGVKLLDFGIAKAATQLAETQAGQVKGKYAYMSPEQTRSREVDPRSDIFALGICLYEVLTSTPLYHRDTVMATMQAIVYDEVPSVRAVRAELPHELDRIVQKALQKDPAHRYQTAAEMHDALERFLAMRQQWVDPRALSAFLDTLFDEDDKSPLPRPSAGQSGPFGSATPSGSGSFGPFGRGPRRPQAASQRVEVPETMPVQSAIETARLGAVSVRRRRALIYALAGLALAGVGVAIGALAALML